MMSFETPLDAELIKELKTKINNDPSYDCSMFGHALNFLNVLDPTATEWTFQTFDDGENKNPKLAQCLHGSLITHFSRLWNLNKQGAGVFVTINETDLKGRKKSNINRVRSIFSDHDTKDPALPSRLHKILEPSIVVESSSDKFHSYWLTNDCDLEDFPIIQKELAKSLDSDTSVCDVSRVLRLPGFYHQKSEPTWVKLRSIKPDLTYTVAEITTALITNRSKTIANQDSRKSTQCNIQKSSNYGLKAVENAIRKITAAPEGDRNNTLNREVFGIAQLVASGEISQKDSFFIPTNLMLAADRLGLPENEVLKTLHSAWESGVNSPRQVIDSSRKAENDESYKPALRPIDIMGYMKCKIEPTRFAIQNILPKRHVTLLSGHGGIGKSALGLIMAAHVASGSKFFGLNSEYRPAIYVSLEDEGNICLDRLKKITKAYSLDIPSIEKNLKIIDGTGNRSLLMEEQTRYSETPTFTQTFTELRHECVENTPALIVVDNSSNSFGANENVRKDVVFFLTGLAQLAKDTDASILLLAHVDKGAAKFGGQGNTYSGSTAWNNSVRSRLALTSDNETGNIRLIHEKANHSSLICDRLFELQTHGIPVPCKPPTKEEKNKILEEDKDVILESIRQANKLNINIGASIRPGNGSAMNCLKDIVHFDEYFGKLVDGKKRASNAIRCLLDEEKLKSEEYKNTSYQVKRRLTIAK